MKVYAVLIEDRHVDVDVELFRDPGDAVERALEVVREYVVDDELFFEPPNDSMRSAGWIFWYRWSEEGDDVRVQEVDL